MKKNQILIIIASAIIVTIFIILFIFPGRQKNSGSELPTPTPAPPKLVEIEVKDRPNISLTPRSDGHELTLKISNISSLINQIEYEITYLATDDNLEIEKGASGIIETEELSTGKSERKILLGTESCTNGCKYKYDTGVRGGKLSLVFSLKNGQMSIFESPFILQSTADLKKAGGRLVWTEENYTYTPKNKPSGTHFYIAHKNYLDSGYLVTSSGAL